MSRDVIRWIAPAIAALFLISVVAIGALFFLAAYFEKRRLVPLASAGSDAPPERSGKADILLAAAETLDFRHLGYFVDRQGFTHPRLSLLISADRQVLAMIVHGRLARFKLIGRLPHGRLLITSQNPEEPDLSLLRVELLEAGRPGHAGEEQEPADAEDRHEEEDHEQAGEAEIMAALGNDDQLGDDQRQPDQRQEQGGSRVDVVMTEKVGDGGELERDDRSDAEGVLGPSDPADRAEEEDEQIIRRDGTHCR